MQKKIASAFLKFFKVFFKKNHYRNIKYHERVIKIISSKRLCKYSCQNKNPRILFLKQQRLMDVVIIYLSQEVLTMANNKSQNSYQSNMGNSNSQNTSGMQNNSNSRNSASPDFAELTRSGSPIPIRSSTNNWTNSAGNVRTRNRFDAEKRSNGRFRIPLL